MKIAKEPSRKVGVAAKFDCIVPAHRNVVVRVGAGNNWPIAIYRALKEIFKDERIKGKRNIFPIRITITNGDGELDD